MIRSKGKEIREISIKNIGMTLLTILALVVACLSSCESRAILSFFNSAYNDNPQYETMELTASLEQWLGLKYSAAVYFINMDYDSIDPAFDISATNLWNAYKVPIMTWMPIRMNSSWNAVSTVLLGNGSEDEYLRAFFNRLSIFISGPDRILHTVDDRRMYIRLGHEMNGGWYPYSQNSNTHTSFISMWKRIVSMARNDFNLSDDQVSFMWCVDTYDGIPGSPAESWYPGNEFVDWVAIDGYNTDLTAMYTSWTEPMPLFKDMVTRLQVYGKPISIPEFGTVPRHFPGACVSKKGQFEKNQWIIDAFAYFKSIDSIRLVSYFNINKDDPGSLLGQSWAFFSSSKDNDPSCESQCFCSEGLGVFNTTSTQSYNVYPQISENIRSNADFWIQSNPLNPRIIDSDSFKGIGVESSSQ